MISILNDNHCDFPSSRHATSEGLLAIGGDLHPDRLIQAYSRGIFLWYNEGEPIQWWTPDPRFVLFPEKLKISKSLRQIVRRDHFDFRINTQFEKVLLNCQQVIRPDQDGTWITNEIIDSYTHLHAMGIAHSAETYLNGQLVGGLYGILMNGIFFGESMFQFISNASKVAFLHWVEHLLIQHVKIIDCQVYTRHLESLGAEMISREAFEKFLPKG